ncbi:MAG: nitroreductase family protein [Euzebyales bacterium]|nr:nitroreductase family protein [Euzebyales bacterium]MBA3620953.1 nitroreductase family protein [Euzebyales bacterium]
MEFADAVRHRRMVRRYTGDPVNFAAVERILDLARRGPSAGFSQGVRFVVVTDPPTRRAIARLCREPEYAGRGVVPWLSAAPVHVVVGVRPGDYAERYAEPDKAASRGPAGWDVPFWWVDAGAALMLLLLGVVDEGLGAGFIDVADPDGIRTLLGIPADVTLVGLVTVGHPASEQPVGSAARGRRPRGQVVHRERW